MEKHLKSVDELISQTQGSINSEVKELSKEDYKVAFSGMSINYCVGLVDMIGSTKISANLHEREWCKYYEIFLNSMSKILQKYGGVTIKNGGDSLLYYFPESSKSYTKYGFISCLECNLAMCEEHGKISRIIQKERLPPLNYRVSSDFGKVVVMEPNALSPMDIIGPPVNMCAKINNRADRNRVVIGGDLYQMVKGNDDYSFKPIRGFSLGFKQDYPIYCMERRDGIQELR